MASLDARPAIDQHTAPARSAANLATFARWARGCANDPTIPQADRDTWRQIADEIDQHLTPAQPTHTDQPIDWTDTEGARP